MKNIFYLKWGIETICRRSTLVLGIILSGGNLIIPRVPLLFLLVGVALVALGHRPLPLQRLTTVFVLLGLIFIFWLIRPGELDIQSLSIRYANFIAAIFLLLVYIRKDKTQLAYDLAWLMPWIAYQTLLTFAIANSLPGLFTKIQNSEGASFNTILFVFNYHNLIENSTGLNRPDSIFFEPGVLQIYLNLYLYVCLFIIQRRKDAIISFIAILSTISTVGTIIAAIQISIYFLKIWRTARLRDRNKIALYFIFLLPFFIGISIYNIDEKFNGEYKGSSMARKYDLYAGMEVIAEHPLIGIGFDHKRYIVETSNLPDSPSDIGYIIDPERQTSNGLLNITYSLGIPISLILLFGLFRQSLLPHKAAVGAIIFTCSLSEALLFTPFFMLFIFSGLILKPQYSTHKPKVIPP